MKTIVKDIPEMSIQSGDKLLAINGHEINDLIDYKYYSADDNLLILIEKPDGSQIEIEYDTYDNGTLEIELEADRIKRCTNKCIFCFIHQLPKGLRKSLYVKDEDYRASFTHGNYITLTNLSESDFERIIEMRLSPLYISVHTTDEYLRKYMLGTKNAPLLMPQLQRLIDSCIEIHTQIVVCPDVNDGEHLEKTIHDLSKLFPGLKSVAIVPVGLTVHREKLPKLRKVIKKDAERILKLCQKYQARYLRKLGTRFIFPADEFLLMTGSEIPPRKYYEDFPQIENGVGMIRQLMSSRRLPKLKLKQKLRASLITGTLASGILEKVLNNKLTGIGNFTWNIIPVKNNLMGNSVTVSGLLGGKDIYRSLKKADWLGDVIFLPPNCLNDDNLFLDDWSPSDLEKKLKKPVVSGCYSVYNTFMPVLRRYI